MHTSSYPRFVYWLWLIPLLLGGALTLLIMVILPPDRTLEHIGDFLFKTAPLVCAVVTIALFPRYTRLLLWCVLLGFVVYMGFVDSAHIFRTTEWVDAAANGNGKAGFPAFYQFTLFVNAFTVLFALFAYRAGGGTSANVLKLGLSGIVVIVSGLNDLTFWLMNPPEIRPPTFDWASHVSIFIGRIPTLADMIGFIGVHLLLVVIIMCLPIQRWIDAIAARWQRTPDSPPATTQPLTHA